jgi:membrane-associated phospholipid phosphatase
MTKAVISSRFRESGFMQKMICLVQDNEIYQFFSKSISQSYTREEAIPHVIVAALAFISLGLYLINSAFFHYWTIPIPYSMMVGFPILLSIWLLIGYTHRQKWPRFGLISATLANIGLFISLSAIGFAAIITTPFPLIDHYLVQWDQWFGFDVTAFMAWAYQYPLFIKVLNFSYFSWEYQVLLTPVLLAVLNKPREINQYMALAAICFIFWLLVYYFFPTLAPAGILHSPHFLDVSYDIVTRFKEVHQSTPITVWSAGGMVSFPSGHVMYALLVLIAWRKIKIIFYPLVILNMLLITATMALGFHYLVDVLASFVIVALAVPTVHLLFKRWERKRLSNL